MVDNKQLVSMKNRRGLFEMSWFAGFNPQMLCKVKKKDIADTSVPMIW